MIDGGVLDNAPFRPALEAIRRAPASGPVQRVLCYVTPYSTSPEERAATRAAPPPLGTVVGAAFNLPRDVTLTETLEDVADYKQRVRNRRASRGTVAVRLGDDGLAEAGARLPRRLRESSCRDVSGRRPSPVRRGHGRSPRTGRGARRAAPGRERSTARRPRRATAVDPRRRRATTRRRGHGGWRRSDARACSCSTSSRGPSPITPSSSDPEDDAALARIVEARSQLSAVGAWVRLRREAYFGAAETRYRDLPLSSDALRPVLTAVERRGPRLRRDRGGGAP